MINQRDFNKKMERENWIGSKKENRKRFRDLINELGVREISLEDIACGDKEKGFIDALNQTKFSLDEAVIIKQYAKAITDSDTRAAEFLRDTKGEKPSNQVEVSGELTGLSAMSLEELEELKAALVAANRDK